VRIVRLPDDRLRVPAAVSGVDCDADATEVIGPEDSRYQEYARLARSEAEHTARERAGEVDSAELFARWMSRYETEQEQRHQPG
jgi:hypothetical protein